MPTALAPEQTNLLEKIHQHLAHLDTKYGFTTRLARENGWKPDFARTVVDEYAKFLFIVREGGHPVSPPHIIDQAWHLHLVHTEEYWGDFCPNVLKMQLHHSPATGTHSQAAMFADWSGQTLASYRKFFGAPPPLWLDSPAQHRPRSPARQVAAIVSAIGGVAIIYGVASANPIPIVLGIIFLVGSVLFHIAARASGVGGKGADGSCGGSSCGSSDGGHGGHGGGHGCGGGHSGCGGGSSCGGGSCGGGGH